MLPGPLELAWVPEGRAMRDAHLHMGRFRVNERRPRPDARPTAAMGRHPTLSQDLTFEHGWVFDRGHVAQAVPASSTVAYRLVQASRQ
jgi:hypothetical protein